MKAHNQSGIGLEMSLRSVLNIIDCRSRVAEPFHTSLSVERGTNMQTSKLLLLISGETLYMS